MKPELRTLTARQFEVLQALTETGTDVGAAKKLGITRRTVEHHLLLAGVKLGTSNRLLLALKFDRMVRRGGGK